MKKTHAGRLNHPPSGLSMLEIVFAMAILLLVIGGTLITVQGLTRTTTATNANIYAGESLSTIYEKLSQDATNSDPNIVGGWFTMGTDGRFDPDPRSPYL